MKKENTTAARKLALAAVVASYMFIATACAGSETNTDMHDNDTWSSSDDYVNSVTNGTDRYRNNGTVDDMTGTSGSYNTDNSVPYSNDNRTGNGIGTGTADRNKTDNGVTGTDRTNDYNNGSLIEDAGDAANRTLNNVGDAANDLLDGAGNVINDATNAGTSRP